MGKLKSFCTKHNFRKACDYLLACNEYASNTDEWTENLKTAYDIFKSFEMYSDAMRVAQKLNDMDLIAELMTECKDRTAIKQMAFMLARQRNPYEAEGDDEIQKIISNEKLSEHYKQLGRELNVVEPKHPDQIFKKHLEDNRGRYGQANVD